MLPDYLVKTGCLSVQLYSVLFNSGDAKSFRPVNTICLPEMLISVLYVYAD